MDERDLRCCNGLSSSGFYHAFYVGLCHAEGRGQDQKSQEQAPNRTQDTLQGKKFSFDFTLVAGNECYKEAGCGNNENSRKKEVATVTKHTNPRRTIHKKFGVIWRVFRRTFAARAELSFGGLS
jgi:hypothetical protein